MRLSHLVFLFTLWSACEESQSLRRRKATAGKGDTDLFRGKGSKVVEIGDESWFSDKAICRALGPDDERYLINFYSGSCGHCQRFASVWEQVAESALSTSCDIRVLAVNCDEKRDICTRFQVDSTPKIVAFSRAGNPCDPSTGHVLSESFQEISEWIKVEAAGLHPMKVLPEKEASEQQDTAELDLSSRVAAEMERKEEQTMSAKELMKRDIANAVRFGLESGVFLGRHELSGEALSAFYAWINLLRHSFPGEAERTMFDTLLGQLKALEAKQGGRINSEAFDSIMSKWEFGKREGRVSAEGKWHPRWSLCHPKRPNEAGYPMMGGYPCALWMLLHTLSVSSATGGATPELTLTAIHGFIEHFFSCNECRENFLASNPDPMKDIIHKATSLSIPPGRALTLWLWGEHNAVSRRLNQEASAEENEVLTGTTSTRIRPVFPVPDRCPVCRNNNEQLASNPSGNLRRMQRKQTRDIEYLTSQVSQGPNARFRESLLQDPHRQQDGPRIEPAVHKGDWDFDNLYSFLLHTYCFNDSILRCPASSPYSLEQGFSFFSKAYLGMFAFGSLLLVITFKPFSRMARRFRRSRKSAKQCH